MSLKKKDNHPPLAQVVQVVLVFHADQWDPGTDAGNKIRGKMHYSCLLVKYRYMITIIILRDVRHIYE